MRPRRQAGAEFAEEGTQTGPVSDVLPTTAFTRNIQDRQIQRDRKWMSGCWGLEEERGGTANGHRVSLGGDNHVLEPIRQ